MFGFPRNDRKDAYRSRHLGVLPKNGAIAEDKLPDRPSLDGYTVCELPECLSVPLLKAFSMRAA